MHVVYVIQSVDDPARFYIGCSGDVQQRLQHHNAGRNPSTRGHRWRLVYYEAYWNASAAKLRETLNGGRNYNGPKVAKFLVG